MSAIVRDPMEQDNILRWRRRNNWLLQVGVEGTIGTTRDGRLLLEIFEQRSLRWILKVCRVISASDNLKFHFFHFVTGKRFAILIPISIPVLKCPSWLSEHTLTTRQ